jgi:two-component system, cell cycle sensor histidine kinase and response regulator CckA
MSGANILYVDDERPMVIMSKLLMRSLGHECEALDSPVEAVDHFQAAPNDYDLVITDFSMPEMNGNELARRLMEIRPEIPVIVLTGSPDPVDRREAYRLGVRAYLEKPVHRSRLGDVINDVLANRAAEDAAPAYAFGAGA